MKFIKQHKKLIIICFAIAIIITALYEYVPYWFLKLFTHLPNLVNKGYEALCGPFWEGEYYGRVVGKGDQMYLCTVDALVSGIFFLALILDMGLVFSALSLAGHYIYKKLCSPHVRARIYKFTKDNKYLLGVSVLTSTLITIFFEILPYSIKKILRTLAYLDPVGMIDHYFCGNRLFDFQVNKLSYDTCNAMLPMVRTLSAILFIALLTAILTGLGILIKKVVKL